MRFFGSVECSARTLTAPGGRVCAVWGGQEGNGECESSRPPVCVLPAGERASRRPAPSTQKNKAGVRDTIERPPAAREARAARWPRCCRAWRYPRPIHGPRNWAAQLSRHAHARTRARGTRRARSRKALAALHERHLCPAAAVMGCTQGLNSARRVLPSQSVARWRACALQLCLLRARALESEKAAAYAARSPEQEQDRPSAAARDGL